MGVRPLPVVHYGKLWKSPDSLSAFDPMERSQYIIAPSTKREKTIWVCGKCKKDHMESILLGKWKLIDRRDDNAIPCDVCGEGFPKDDTAEPLTARREDFIRRFT